jgi:exoribonuclease R
MIYDTPQQRYDATEPIKVFIHDAQYHVWDYVTLEPKQATSIKDKLPFPLPHPLEHKWFNQDIVNMNSSPPTLVFSPVRHAPHIPGVLILEGNRTYGRTKNRKRLLYKCIPDDRHLPHFFVPYDIVMDFNKAHKNKYVLFNYQDWEDEHPHGRLVETLGDVNQFEAFYEYQLYSKSLHSSVKEMTQRIKEMTKKKPMDEYFQQILHNPTYAIQNTTTLPHPPQIFTIDPPNTVDYDDGLSIEVCPENPNRICVTVYIAQVVFWLEAFQLWNSFDNRIATIYLPDRRRPMLPSLLSESLCSLREHTQRFAVSVQFFVDTDTENRWTVDESATKIQNVMISPYKNYVYEETKLVYQDVHYMRLLDTTARLAAGNHNIKNSRDVVSYWMVKTNTFMAQYMIQHQTGIFRVGKYLQRQLPRSKETFVKNKEEEEDEEEEEDKTNYELLDPDTRRFIEYHAKAQSVCYDASLNLEHEVLNKQAYLRITSVIRRYEDVCNECELMRIMGIKLRNGESLKDHYNDELCNERYQNIRRVESESVMMTRTYLGENTVKGIIYSRVWLEDGRYEYKLYVKGEGIKEVRTRDKKELYTEHTMKRYIKEKGGGMKVKMEFVV